MNLSLGKRIAIFVVFVAVFIYSFYLFLNSQKRQYLYVSFLNVGQGDAIYIKSPSGADMIIDGGRGGAVLRELGRSMSFFDRTVDVVLATHPDADHIGGLPQILDKYNVRNFVNSGMNGESDISNELDKLINSKKVSKWEVLAGSVIDLGGGVTFTILSPENVSNSDETNDTSIVGRLVYGETEFMLTGDAPQWIENKISSKFSTDQIDSDVLKVGHHGSKTSSGELFLSKISPEYTVISAGVDNQYGHPHNEVLDRLKKNKTKILRTDLDGRIIFESNGVNLNLR